MFQVQVADLAGKTWTTIWRGEEAQARQVFIRHLLMHSKGRFRLLDSAGVVVSERLAQFRFRGPVGGQGSRPEGEVKSSGRPCR